MVVYTICRTPPRARYLPLRHAAKALRKKTSTSTAAEPEELESGQERLYSYYEPPLAAGPHTITTSQKVHQDGQKDLSFEASQEFTVVAPRYTLPDDSIHSIYPPQGHADNVEILPHVVLNDPFLPWTRKVKEVDDLEKERNRVPWLALLVFTQEELRLPAEDMSHQQSNTLAVNLSLAELSKLNCATPALQASGSPWDDDDKDTRADFVLVPKALFGALFRDYEANEQERYDVSAYQWLAHMRHIDTTGMANSGINGEKGSFGVVLSRRTGPLDVTEPTDLVVHLVSIEKIPYLHHPVEKERVALCSLESWTYTCLPPNSFNVRDAFRYLGEHLKVLRMDPAQVEKGLAGKSLPQRLKKRLEDGYTMTRYRTQTGEETAAWTRGPLVPTIVKEVDPVASKSGTELQVIDRVTSIMDVTYSVAWQLGKTLALSDQGFATALGRLRIIISRTAIHEAKKAILKQKGVFRDRQKTLRDLGASLMTLRSLPPEGLMSGPDARWRSSQSIPSDLSHSGDLMRDHFSTQLAPTVQHLTSSTTKDEVYNEMNTPRSPDWMVVFSWILDRMYLSEIPAHYLLPDPAYLPIESLRFFHVDRNWINAFVDGALSIANHLPNDDTIPIELKRAINKYLQTKPDGLTYPPGFGFLLRSELCVKFPDLIVEAYRSGASAPDPTLILRQENIAEGVLLVMFDKEPGGKELEKLILREPPHQQAFSAGTGLEPKYLKVSYKKIFTIPLSDQEKVAHRTTPVRTLEHHNDGSYIDEQTQETGTGEQIFVWEDEGVNVHSLRLPAYAKQVHKVLTEDQEMKTLYEESGPTATLMGIQLNHPMYHLEISLKKSQLFPTLSHLNGDDGILTSLQTLTTPKRSARRTKQAATIQLSTPDVTPIDWRAPFVAFPETSEDFHSGANRSAPRLPAPHVRRLARADEFANAQADEPAYQRHYSRNPTVMVYSVFPLTKSPSSPANKISKLNIKQDLIFSLRRFDEAAGANYNVRRIVISIPHGTPKSRVPTLMDQYDGAGATMISDFRFNAVPTLHPESNELVISVVPRASTFKIERANYLSFMLGGVMVADYTDRDKWKPGSEVSVTIKVLEMYENTDDLSTYFKVTLTL